MDVDWSWQNDDWKETAQKFEWKYSSKATEAAVELQKIADDIHGQFVYLAPPTDSARAIETATKYFIEVPGEVVVETEAETITGSFSGMLYTLSSLGHLVVASHIRTIIDQARVLQTAGEVRDTVGNWGSGDHC